MLQDLIATRLEVSVPDLVSAIFESGGPVAQFGRAPRWHRGDSSYIDLVGNHKSRVQNSPASPAREILARSTNTLNYRRSRFLVCMTNYFALPLTTSENGIGGRGRIRTGESALKVLSN